MFPISHCFHQKLCIIRRCKYRDHVPAREARISSGHKFHTNEYNHLHVYWCLQIHIYSPSDFRPVTTLPWYTHLLDMHRAETALPTLINPIIIPMLGKGDPPASSPRVPAKIDRTPRSSHRKSVNFHHPPSPFVDLLC